MDEFIINKGLLGWLNDADNVDDVFSCDGFAAFERCTEEEQDYIIKLFRAYIYFVIDNSYFDRLDIIEKINFDKDYVQSLLHKFAKGCKKASMSDAELMAFVITSKNRYNNLVSYIEDPKYENISYYDELIRLRINQVIDEHPYFEIDESLLLKLVKCAIVKENIAQDDYLSFLDNYLNILSICKFVYKIYENSNSNFIDKKEERDNSTDMLNILANYVRVNDFR